MTTAIERLNESARALLALHFLALPARDRYLRFASPVTQPLIARYVDGIDFEQDAVFAIHAAAIGDPWRGALAGVVHAAFPDDSVELGVSVLPAYRGRGLASALTQRAAAHARSRGARRLSMHLLGENAPMIRIARKLGMTISGMGANLCARLELIRRGRRGDVRSGAGGFEPAHQQRSFQPDFDLRSNHEHLA